MHAIVCEFCNSYNSSSLIIEIFHFVVSSTWLGRLKYIGNNFYFQSRVEEDSLKVGKNREKRRNSAVGAKNRQKPEKLSEADK